MSMPSPWARLGSGMPNLKGKGGPLVGVEAPEWHGKPLQERTGQWSLELCEPVVGSPCRFTSGGQGCLPSAAYLHVVHALDEPVPGGKVDAPGKVALHA